MLAAAADKTFIERGNELIRNGEVCLVLYAGASIMFEDKMKEYSVGMCKMSLPSDKTVF